jgi:hypothetical protein
MRYPQFTEVERNEREGPLLYKGIEADAQSGGSGTGAKVADTEFIPARWQRGWLGARINHWRRRIWDDARTKIVARGAVEG